MATDTHSQGTEADAAHASASRQLERLVEIRASLAVAQEALASMRGDPHADALAAVNEFDRVIATARQGLADLTVALRSDLADLRRATKDAPRTRGHRY